MRTLGYISILLSLASFSLGIAGGVLALVELFSFLLIGCLFFAVHRMRERQRELENEVEQNQQLLDQLHSRIASLEEVNAQTVLSPRRDLTDDQVVEILDMSD